MLDPLFLPILHPQHLQNGRPLLKRLSRFSRRPPRSKREKGKKAAANVDAMNTVRVVAFTMKRLLADSCNKSIKSIQELLSFPHAGLEWQGYDTLLSSTGVEGIQLSGQQRQRLAIARAWIRDPDVLILGKFRIPFLLSMFHFYSLFQMKPHRFGLPDSLTYHGCYSEMVVQPHDHHHHTRRRRNRRARLYLRHAGWLCR